MPQAKSPVAEANLLMMKVSTPNNRVSSKDKEMGYKLVGNRIEVVEKLNRYTTDGAYLGKTINRKW